MKRAQYGSTNIQVTLKEFMDLEGSTDPKKWVTKPYCPDCGEPVHSYDKRGALGFRAARNEVTQKRERQPQPGFHHYDVDKSDTTSAVLTCPSSFRDDPRFKLPELR